MLFQNSKIFILGHGSNVEIAMISNMYYLNSLSLLLLKKKNTTKLYSVVYLPQQHRLHSSVAKIHTNSDATMRAEVDCIISFKKGCHENDVKLYCLRLVSLSKKSPC